MSIGSRIKEARQTNKLTQEELAKAVSVTKGAIANYENEISTPKLEILIKLMYCLDVDANFLYQDNFLSSSNSSMELKSPDEQTLIENYRKLNEEGAEKAQDYISDLVDTGKYKKFTNAEMASENLA